VLDGLSGFERQTKQGNDPRTGEGFAGMVPDTSRLPHVLDSAKYDVSMSFARR